jgi:UDP-3-O-[3-hydroxymyristoyl] glucosamine N-acyltransferase
MKYFENPLPLGTLFGNQKVLTVGREQNCLGISAIDNASEGLLTFLRGARLDLAAKALDRGAIVILNRELEPEIQIKSGTCVFVSHPEEVFARVVSELFSYPSNLRFTGDREIKVSTSSIVLPGVFIHAGVVVGESCFIKSGAVIGGPGFGIFRNSDSNLEHFPHVGGVVLGDFVEVGSFTTIASGSISPTRVGRYTKIDDHVHIAHNVTIGDNTTITAGVIVGGSVRIGANVWIGLGAIIRDGVEIADNVIIGMGAVVTVSISVPGTYIGIPAKLIGAS